MDDLDRVLDPRTTPETLADLARTTPALRPYIALHPRTDPTLLDQFGQDVDEDVRRALAQRAGWPVGGPLGLAPVLPPVRPDGGAHLPDPPPQVGEEIPSQPPPSSASRRWVPVVAAVGVIALLVAAAAVVLPRLRGAGPTFADGAELGWEVDLVELVGAGVTSDQLGSVVDGVLVMGARRGSTLMTLGLDARTGEQLWQTERGLMCLPGQRGEALCVDRDPTSAQLLRLDPTTGRVLAEHALPGHPVNDKGGGLERYLRAENGMLLVVTQAYWATSTSTTTVVSPAGDLLSAAVELPENTWAMQPASDGSLLVMTQEPQSMHTAGQLLGPEGQVLLELTQQADGAVSGDNLRGATALLLPDGTLLHTPGLEVTGESAGRSVVQTELPGWLWLGEDGRDAPLVLLSDGDGVKRIDPESGQVLTTYDVAGMVAGQIGGAVRLAGIVDADLVVLDLDGSEVARHRATGQGGWLLVGGVMLGFGAWASAESVLSATNPLTAQVVWQTPSGYGFTGIYSEELIVLTGTDPASTLAGLIPAEAAQDGPGAEDGSSAEESS